MSDEHTCDSAMNAHEVQNLNDRLEGIQTQLEMLNGSLSRIADALVGPTHNSKTGHTRSSALPADGYLHKIYNEVNDVYLAVQSMP